MHITSQKDLRCGCCLHARLVGDWSKEWCEPQCVLTLYPEWVWGLWELLEFCMTPISAGMSAVYVVDPDRTERWCSRLGITDLDEFLKIHGLLKFTMSEWDSNQKLDLFWGTKDLEFLREIDAQERSNIENQDHH